MSDSGLISSFKFESYKVDKLTLTVQPNTGLLSFRGVIPSEEWEFGVGFRNPQFFKNINSYVSGLDLSLTLLNEEGKSQKASGKAVDEKNIVLSLDAGIAGIFSVEAGRFDEKTEKFLVKVQAPALLLPYLRGTITSLLANAGFGTVIFPLINIHEMAKSATVDVDVQVIEG